MPEIKDRSQIEKLDMVCEEYLRLSSFLMEDPISEEHTLARNLSSLGLNKEEIDTFFEHYTEVVL